MKADIMTFDVPSEDQCTFLLDRRKVLGGALLAGASSLMPTSTEAKLAPATFATAKSSLSSGRLVVTTQNTPWHEGEHARMVPNIDFEDMDIAVVPEITAQTIEGFGACFNELGWDALAKLTPDDRAAIFEEIFGSQGAGFSLCRMPIGANDFSRDWYSFDEVKDDFSLDHFSIARDETSLVPFINAAKRIRPDLKLWASPWSPPTWMKRNGHYAMAQSRPNWPPNGLRADQIGREGSDMFILEERYLDAYARYFGRFIDEYRKRDIVVGMVMPQNEFNSAQPFPSCVWTPEGLAKFLPFLGKEMDRRNVEVMFGTMERPDYRLFERVNSAPDVAQYLKGVGVQWAGKSATPIIHALHPELRLYQTEQECGDGKNDWRYARYAWSLLKHYMSSGANAYQYWNIALIDGGISTWGWSQNSLLSVDPRTRAYRWNHEYWLMKHLSATVRPGARRLVPISYKGFDDILAFSNPDGSIALVMNNPLGQPMRIRAAVGRQKLEILLPADCFASLVLDQEMLTPAPA